MSFLLWRWACSRPPSVAWSNSTGWLPRWHLFVMRSATTAPVLTLRGIARQVALLGLGTIAIWIGLRLADLDGEGSVWLVVFAVSRVLIAGFPVDLPGAQRTNTGVVHNVLAAAAFTSSAVAASTLSGWLTDTPAWAFDGAWYRWSGGFVAVVAVALAVVWVVPALRRGVFGLVERFWYAATIAWLAVTATGLLVS